MRLALVIAFVFSLSACGPGSEPDGSDDAVSIAAYEALTGFIDLYWDEQGGRLLIRVDELDTQFIYQS